MMSFVSRMILTALWVSLGLLCLDCGGASTRTTVAREGSGAVRNACLELGLIGCDELGSGFGEFVDKDKVQAARFIEITVNSNGDMVLDDLTETIELASTMSKSQRDILERFGRFATEVVKNALTRRKKAPMALTRNSPGRSRGASNGSSPGGVEAYGGCGRDDQCKGDRVCVANQCVSPKHAELLETRYLASKGVEVFEDAEAEPAGVITLSQVAPTISQELCTPATVAQCVKRCDNDDKLSCFTAARIYENMPSAGEHADYIVDAYVKACDEGVGAGCVNLSRMYLTGRLVEEDAKRAFELNEQACSFKDMHGCANVAQFFEKGVGVPRDPKRAGEYYSTACRYGHADSCAVVEAAKKREGDW